MMLIAFMLPISYARAAEEEDGYIFSKVEDSIYVTFLSNGYSPAGACGILGNMSVENPTFDPDLYGTHGYTYGLFQWSDTGKRLTRLRKWCNNRLLYHNRVDGQLAYAMYELQGGDYQASKLDSFLKTTDDAELAAMEFAVGFERCIGSTGDDLRDGVYMGSIYPERYGETYQALTLRMQNALAYYEKYKDTELDENLNLKVKKIPTAGIVSEEEDAWEEVIQRTFPVFKARISETTAWIYRIICLVIGYLFGCILGASIIGRAVHKRTFKKGHKLPSIQNVLKYIGVKETIFAVLIDASKFYLALGICYLITGGALMNEQILWVGIGVILGNAFPFWRGFKGGMGIVVTVIFLCTYMPIWGVVCVLMGLIVALIFKSFPFGALFISIFAVPYAFILRGWMAGVFFLITMVILLYRHYNFIMNFVDKELLHKHYEKYTKKPTKKSIKKEL